jgi:hypothetical protein
MALGRAQPRVSAVPRAMVMGPLYGVALLTYELQTRWLRDRWADTH